MNPTTTKISNNFAMWGEYVDPMGTMTESEFDALSTVEKNLLQKSCFPDESTEDGQEDE